MIQLAQEIGVPIPTKNDVKLVMGTIDTDGSGKIEFEEFQALIKSVLQSLLDDAM